MQKFLCHIPTVLSRKRNNNYYKQCYGFDVNNWRKYGLNQINPRSLKTWLCETLQTANVNPSSVTVVRSIFLDKL